MNINEFEDSLTQMTKPEVNQLKHEDMLAKEMIKAKDRSVVSIWWLAPPFYILGMLLIKALFNPEGNFFNYLVELVFFQKYLAISLFYLIPGILICINSWSIWKIYFIAGRPQSIRFIKSVWLNVLIILLALILLLL
ncbi:MAG: hypothetical protein ABI761_12845 [Saprospiraceae bacterium]